VYVKDMELHGSLFKDGCTTGTISCAFTNFYVDHNEPLEALAAYKAGKCWVLGELLEGHKFLIILPAQKPIAPPDVFQWLCYAPGTSYIFMWFVLLPLTASRL